MLGPGELSRGGVFVDAMDEKRTLRASKVGDQRYEGMLHSSRR
jgi:hypothetical protein